MLTVLCFVALCQLLRCFSSREQYYIIKEMYVFILQIITIHDVNRNELRCKT